VGATDIDYLIPEYWRISGLTEELNPSDRYLIAALSLPMDLLAHGVFSVQANQDLEAIDAMLAELATAAHASNSAAVVAIVSDHGFIGLTHRLNLFVAFLRAGLITTAQDPATQAPKIIPKSSNMGRFRMHHFSSS
jgi:hypothetical protein